MLTDIHNDLQKRLQHGISFITLSEKGVFYAEDNNNAIIPSHIRSIADVSGAGDTVIAVASLVYAARKNAYLMAEIANIAGGLVCEEVGTADIDKQKLFHESELLLSRRDPLIRQGGSNQHTALATPRVFIKNRVVEKRGLVQ